MGIGVGGAMRVGLVSGKAAAKWKKPAILNATRAQKGKMADFDGSSKDEGAKSNSGAVGTRKEVNASAQQRDRVSSMPSKKTGGAGYAALTRGSKSPQGGAVGDSYTPGRRAIDQFPQRQAKTFPKGAGFEGRRAQTSPLGAKTDNSRMKGKKPLSSGGPAGGNSGNKAYYGGPNGRDGNR